MASWMYMSVCIIAALVVNTVSGARISTTPSTITVGGLNPTAQLRITCTPTTSDTILVIEIGKQLTPGVTESNKAIVQILVANPTTVNVIDTSLQQRMESSGSISGTTGNLEITLTDLRCSDADYPYYCATTVNTAGGVRTNEDSSNITVRSNPGDIAMTLRPDFSVYSNTPILVEFLCTGLIGNQFDQNMNMANYWVWEWRYVDNLNSAWVRYPNTNNITYRSPVPNPSGSRCQYDGGSTLTHTITTLDNGRQFRCYVVSSDFGNNRTVYTQAPAPTEGPNTGENTDPQGANVGMIVGIVIGVLAVIVIVVVLVYFLVFRRKSGGDDYDTGEGKEDRPPMTDNVVYSTPASREPSRMKGRENNAMDEPHEKNPRPYYPKDYDKGQNNPAMDDDSRHDNSFDDDNTDSRMRAPYGSAV